MFKEWIKPANLPPIANAGPDQTPEAGDPVILDGSASSDPEGAPLTYTWTWTDNSGVLNTASGEKPTITLPLNTPTTITLIVNDGQLDSVPDTVVVTMKDTLPPTITSGKPIILWPPEHKYKTFSISDLGISVTDKGDPTVTAANVYITHVTSDELEDAKGNGDGNTIADIVINGLQSVDLRAERLGAGNGRVYTIYYEVKDASGTWVQDPLRSGSPMTWYNPVAVPDDASKYGYEMKSTYV